MKSIDLFRASSIAMATAISCGSTTTWAQQTPVDAAASEQSGDAAEQAGGIEEIIVTARKRSEVTRDVPVALTAYSSDQLQRYNTQDLAAIAQMTPQLVIGGSGTPTGAVISLRGIGSGASNPGTDQAVSLNVDGIQVSQGNISRLGQLDLARVEVLKGPQALFYGKNSPAGVISMVSADPTRDFEGKIRAGYELKNEQKFIEAILSGPLTEELGARLVVYGSKQEGWFKNLAAPLPALGILPSSNRGPDQSEIFTRLTVAYNSTGGAVDAKVKLAYNRLNDDSGFTSTIQKFACPTLTSSLASSPATGECRADRNFTKARIREDAAALSPNFRDGNPYLRSRQFLGSAEVNLHPSDQFTITSVTGYYFNRETFADNFAFGDLPFVFGGSELRNRQWTEELRLATSFDGPINFVAGGFYQWQRIDSHPYVGLDLGLVGVPGAAPALILDPDLTVRTKAGSIFGQLIFDITSTLQLTAGGRWSKEKRRISGTVPSTTGRVPYLAAKPELNFSNFSPEATLRYKPSDNLTLYGSYRTGFISGGFELSSGAGALSDPSFRPEKVKGGEIGAKGLFLDRQLQVEFAAFDYKYTNLQLSAYDPAAVALRTVNAGSAKTRGLELSAQFEPSALPEISFHGAVAYTEAKYGDTVTGCYAGQGVAAGCNLLLDNAGIYQGQQLAGQRLVRAPLWSSNIGAVFESEINSDLGLAASFDANYSSSYQTMFEADPRARQGGFVKLNTSLSVFGNDKAWELSLIGKNIMNELTIANTFPVTLTGSGTGTAGPIVASELGGSIDAPRTITLQLTLRF